MSQQHTSQVVSSSSFPEQQQQPTRSVVVYCASSSKLDRKYFLAAEQVGKVCAENGFSVRYGGGNSGLMVRRVVFEKVFLVNIQILFEIFK